MERLLITGASGFVGANVRRAMESGSFAGRELVSPPSGWDIRNYDQVRDLVRATKPDAVLHLAAQSFVPRSFEMPRETYDINVIGTLNLLLALRDRDFAGRMVYVSSGDVYGQVSDQMLPVDEQLQPLPRSPYAASKLAAEQLCMQWHRSEQLDVIVARPFNHIGPGQDARFAVASFAAQIADIERKVRPPVLKVGDLDTTRDFTDVRDVVRAYDAMFQNGINGRIYIVASGVERRGRDILARLLEISGVQAEIIQDTARMRPTEQRRMFADASLLRAETGWQPQFTFDQTLYDLYKSARSKE